MKKVVNFLRSIDRIWLIVWVLIYLGFMTISAFFPDVWEVSILKVIGVVLCVVYAYQKFRNDPLLIIALGFTMLADVILALDNVSLLGVFVFCIAQFFHVARMSNINSSLFIVYLVAIAIVFSSLTLILKIDPMYSMSSIYGAGLLSNIFLAMRWFIKENTTPSRCALIGFILFFCCDFCVAISYLSNTNVLPSNLAIFANYFAWAFYYPSQVLISNSSTSSVKVDLSLNKKRKQ